jgi:hypothetical protein
MLIGSYTKSGGHVYEDLAKSGYKTRYKAQIEILGPYGIS